MSCCGHSHTNPEDKSCGTKKCCGKGGKLLLLLAVFALGAFVGHTVDFPPKKMAMEDRVNHEGHDMAAMENAKKNAYNSAMTDMHEAMSEVETTGDADIDFVKGMIPHHQGAIDMAKIVERKGADPEIKKLAEGIIAAQKKEIAEMKTWLKTAEAKFKEEAKKAEAVKKAEEDKKAAEVKAKAADVDSDGDEK